MRPRKIVSEHAAQVRCRTIAIAVCCVVVVFVAIVVVIVFVLNIFFVAVMRGMAAASPVVQVNVVITKGRFS